MPATCAQAMLGLGITAAERAHLPLCTSLELACGGKGGAAEHQHTRHGCWERCWRSGGYCAARTTARGRDQERVATGLPRPAETSRDGLLLNEKAALAKTKHALMLLWSHASLFVVLADHTSGRKVGGEGREDGADRDGGIYCRQGGQGGCTASGESGGQADPAKNVEA